MGQQQGLILYGSSNGKSKADVLAMFDRLLADMDAGRVGLFIIMASAQQPATGTPAAEAAPPVASSSRQLADVQQPLETAKEREARKRKQRTMAKAHELAAAIARIKAEKAEKSSKP